MPNIQHQKRQLPNGDMLFFTGEAKATVIIHNEHEEQRLKAWAIDSFKLIRNCQGATFKVFAFTMLECVNCKSSNLHFCHHPSQCKLNCHQKSLQTEIPDPNAEKQRSDYIIETSTTEMHGESEKAHIQPASPNSEQIEVSEMENDNLDCTLDVETDSEPVNKAKKSGKTSILCGLYKTKILGENDMIKAYPEAQHQIDERHNIRIEYGNQKSTNELLYIEQLTAEEQETLFENYSL